MLIVETHLDPHNLKLESRKIFNFLLQRKSLLICMVQNTSQKLINSSNGFWQIPIDKDSSKLLTIILPLVTVDLLTCHLVCIVQVRYLRTKLGTSVRVLKELEMFRVVRHTQIVNGKGRERCLTNITVQYLCLMETDKSSKIRHNQCHLLKTFPNYTHDGF